jgi:hypothetical protein
VYIEASVVKRVRDDVDNGLSALKRLTGESDPGPDISLDWLINKQQSIIHSSIPSHAAASLLSYRICMRMRLLPLLEDQRQWNIG